MAKKNAAAQAKARQKKIARKENKRKERRREVRSAADEAAAVRRGAESALESANNLFYDAEDAVDFLTEPDADATEQMLDDALDDMHFGLEQSLRLAAAAVLPNTTAVAAALHDLGFVFRPGDHLRMIEVLIQQAELRDVPELVAAGSGLVAEWALLARSDSALQAQVEETLRYIAAPSTERIALTMERLKQAGLLSTDLAVPDEEPAPD